MALAGRCLLALFRGGSEDDQYAGAILLARGLRALEVIAKKG